MSLNGQNFALCKEIGVKESNDNARNHWKCINSHFCTHTVKVLLKVSVNATECSTFEVLCGK